ncbi:Na+/H+ antiporter NhaC family protein [Treponema sp.]|uniref:Na+/H+ antiporter NhaC family protein n=1 Tax=Treponema sp. TaxID=166 RepID=UPI0025F11AED|nr:Na+/H+ antiporter NhaC family protein [Treponema sp.]MBR4322054.1 Na+/H+ antiporter NhaC family protein [Treponema sp.]
MTGTFFSLVPPIVAIALALITKEVYSSLFIGILIGGAFFAIDASSGFTGFFTHVFNDGMIKQLSDSWNVGILVFLVVLGAMVALMNKAGGSQAFGEWAKKHIKSKLGAQVATVCLGVLIFIDDYFNCLTVGSVMRPITKKYKVSREKLAYLIDATAAPVCIIAPISSWAAAVAGFVSEGENGLALFCKAIPFNFYAFFTIGMMFLLIFMNFEFGPMAKYEESRENMNEDIEEEVSTRGKVFDLVFPIASLIILCTMGMIYTGGFFASGEEHKNFIDAFANSDASVGLVIGSFAALLLTIVIYQIRRVISFKDCMTCIPDGFKAMVPAILILTLAWTLKAMTDSLGAAKYVAGLVEGSAKGFQNFLPAIIFVIAGFLAFATGTSWGTFGILIPICIAVFPGSGDPLRIISISACMAGAVAGDHCSPISDTTIMASAGAQCEHVNHVSTQLPYALTVGGVSFVTYIVAGFTQALGIFASGIISWLMGIILLVASLLVLKKKFAAK